MSADELRAGFSRLAERVVPMEDPHGRLMLRRRKRFRARLASFAAVTMAALVGGMAGPATLLNTASPPEHMPEVIHSTPSLSSPEYVDRLAKAPLRGNLSADRQMADEVRRAFDAFEKKPPGTKEANLVFLNRTKQMLQAVVIYTTGTGAFAVARGALPGGNVEDLVSGVGGFQAVSPFLVLQVGDSYGKETSVVGLAPPGCAVEASVKGGFTGEGSWDRSYEPEPTGDYIVRYGHTINELWRVSCEGRTREVRTADDNLDSMGVNENASIMYERVVRFGGVVPDRGTVQWRGAVPGSKSEATLVSSRLRPGPAVLVIGPFLKPIIATDILEKASPTPLPRPTTTGKDGELSMIALGVAADGVTVVRVPRAYGERSVLSDQVFVYTQTSAIRIEAIDSQQKVVATAPVDRGVAILLFSPGVAAEIRAVSAGGAPKSSVRFAEPAKGSWLLGDQLFKDW